MGILVLVKQGDDLLMQRTSTNNSPLFVGVNRLELRGFSPCPSAPSHIWSGMNLKTLTHKEILVFNGRTITMMDFEKAKNWYLDEINHKQKAYKNNLVCYVESTLKNVSHG